MKPKENNKNWFNDICKNAITKINEGNKPTTPVRQKYKKKSTNKKCMTNFLMEKHDLNLNMNCQTTGLERYPN